MVYIAISFVGFGISLLQRDIIVSLSFLILFLALLSTFISTKIERKKKERKDFFDSLLKPIPKMTKEGYSTTLTLVVPSPQFFNEMIKNK